MSKYQRLADLQARLAVRPPSPIPAPRQAAPKPQAAPAPKPPRPVPMPVPSAPDTRTKLTLAKPADAPAEKPAPAPAPAHPAPAPVIAEPAADPVKQPEAASPAVAPSLAELWGCVELVKTWRASGNGQYWGTVDVDVPHLGLRIREIPLRNGLKHIQMPARPLLDMNGTRRRRENGSPMYVDVLQLYAADAYKAFSRAVRREVLRQFPELAHEIPKPETTDASQEVGDSGEGSIT